MATTTTRPKTPGMTGTRAAKRAKPKAVASKALVATAKKGASGNGVVNKAARKGSKAVARKGSKALGRRALHSGAELIRTVTSRSAELSREALEAGMAKRPPIQVSVDVAVPLPIAWREWISFSAFTEGLHQIEDIERDGDQLFGRTTGQKPVDWAADIVDERDQESFAWRSTEGSDCAGLVTFHRLSDRLTRIELDLDVLPTAPTEVVALALHLADRRAETTLRRFKAEVEFINPDVYEHELRQNVTRTKQRRNSPRDY